MDASEGGAKIETGSQQMLVGLFEEQPLKDICVGCFPDGLKPKDVVELSGKAASGKSEFLYHLIVRCLFPLTWNDLPLNGLDCGVVFVDNDYHFDMMRLVVLLEYQLSRAFHRANARNKPSVVEKKRFIKVCLEKLYILRCSSMHQFIVTLHSLESFFAQHLDVQLLVIDSISAFHWWDRLVVNDNIFLLFAQYQKMVSKLGQLVDDYKLTLLASRQTLLNQDGGSNFDYMGNEWKKFVTTRVHVEAVPSEMFQRSSAILCTVTPQDGNKLKRKLLIKNDGITFIDT